jgi:hypothetical protein
VTISSFELSAQSGWLYLDLDHEDGTHAQAYAVTMESAEGRYSAGSVVLPFDNYCNGLMPAGPGQ